MDFKILSKFIFVLGIIVLGYGIVQFVFNLPQKYKPNPVTEKGFKGIQQGIDEFGRRLQLNEKNTQRVGKRKSAGRIMIAGGVVIFVGIAVFVSTKKKDIKKVSHRPS